MKLRKRREGERGQVLVLAALTMTVTMAFAALAIDVGFWLHTRTKLQADVDAMALAGAQQLCAQVSCDSSAITTAESYAEKNALDDSEYSTPQVGVDCDGNTSSNHDWITVRANRTEVSFLAQIVGIPGAEIHACATARKAALSGATGIVPFGIEDDCLGVPEYGDPYTLKFDSDPDSDGAPGVCDKFKGNYGALAIDASGAGPPCGTPPSTEDELKFKQAVCFGANRELCASTDPDCVGEADDDTCASQPVADDQICTEPGNMTGPVGDGVQYRMDHTSTACDTFEEVTFPSGGLRPECNPWLGAQSARVIMIPVVDGLFTGNGRHRVTIMRFAIFFLDTFVKKDCKGSDCDITGRFIETSLSASYLDLDDLDPNSDITVVRLIK